MLAVSVQSLFILLFPLQWITIVDIGGFSLKVAHLSVIALSLLAWATTFSGRGRVQINPFYFLFMLVLVIQLGSLMWSEDVAAGLSAVARSFFYLAISLGIYFWFVKADMGRFSVLASRLFCASVAILYALIMISFAIAGQNFFTVVFEALFSGNPNALQYRVFYKLFNDYSLAPSELENYSSAARHTIALSLVFLSIIASVALRRVAPATKTLVLASMLAVLFFLAISMSRSAVFSLLVPIVFLLHIVVLRRPGPVVLMGVFGLLIGLIAVSVASVSDSTGGVTEVLQGKFIDDIVNNPRINDFGDVIANISENPWVGAGIGTPIRGLFIRSDEVHNFFFHVWHGTGIVGAIAALALGAYLVSVLIGAYRGGIKADSFEIACIYLIVVYALSSSLLRMSVAGGGDISLSEWCMLAIGLAFADRLNKPEGRKSTGANRTSKAAFA